MLENSDGAVKCALELFEDEIVKKGKKGNGVRAETFTVVLLGGLVSACGAVALSSLFVTVLLASQSVHDFRQGVTTFFVVCFFAMFPAGSFGFCAGILGTAWLRQRRFQIHSKPRLTMEAAVVGALLASPFAFIHRALRLAGQKGTDLDFRLMLLSIAIGMCCAVVFSLAASRFLLTDA